MIRVISKHKHPRGRPEPKMPSQVSLEDVDCPLGCRTDDEVIVTGSDRLHNLPGEFTVVKCRNCGLMRTNPRPTSGTIGFYYPDDYGPYIGTRVTEHEEYGRGRLKNSVRPFIRKIFDPKDSALPPIRSGHLLEIGCASGAFLRKMSENGWQVEGIEFSERAATAARKLGYKVHCGALENAPAPSRPADLTVGWMVLEHLHDPVGCLKKLRDWASPDGWLVVSVPDANSKTFAVFKSRWYALQLPHHLYHYTPETIKKVLRSGGWEVKKIYHQRSLTNLIASAAYAAEDRKWNKLASRLRNFAGRGGIWFYFLFPIAWCLAVFGESGRMTVWAQKVDPVPACEPGPARCSSECV